MTSKTAIRALWLCSVVVLLSSRAHAQLRAVPFVTGLDLPVEFVQNPADASIQFVAELSGRVRVVKDGTLQPTPFLDLTSVVALGGERGLLGLAFPPDYASSRRFYVYYTRTTQPGDSAASDGGLVVARYKRSVGNALVADPATRKDLVFGSVPYIPHSTFANHNGGHLAFGPDGLYVGTGDGGGGNDPFNSGQDPTSLLGKILRLDVGVADGDATGYGVPAGNPFVGGLSGFDPALVRKEIWALGLRNPWKFSFDEGPGGTSALVIADVGQGGWEEIDYEPANHGGRNYGWKNREGAHDTPGITPVTPALLPLTNPVFEYDHSVGNSITGGFVYRGSSMRAAYRGRYFYADFIRGRVWSLGLTINGAGEATAADVVEHTGELGGSDSLGGISAFGRDSRGELYIVSISGTIFKIVSLSDLQVVPFDDNGDAFKDVLLYDRLSGEWTVQLGNAQGQFDPGFSGGWATGWEISVADFNADGLDDLFLYSRSTGVFFKVVNTGSGFSDFSQGWLPNLSTTIVDLNGDGQSDVFLYDAATGLWFTCISVGGGTTGFQYGSGTWGPGLRVLPADFDGDGNTDFLAYEPAGGAFFKAITRGNGIFIYSHGGWAAGWTPFVAELSGDAFDDVFLYSEASGVWFRCKSTGDGTGGFAYVQGGWVPAWLVQPADFDGDGRTDLFLYGWGGTWYKVLNNGTAFTYVAGGWRLWSTSITDLNGDGHSDVLLYDSGTWVQALTTSPGAFTYTTGVF